MHYKEIEMLGRSVEQWQEVKAIFTAGEIFQQPSTWRKTIAQIGAIRDELKEYIDLVVSQDDYEIILSGAGTSEYIGNAAVHALNCRYGFHMRSVSTTDIVLAPRKCLSATRPTLLVSFGRSGDSPESIGAVEAAETVCSNLHHLFITCNPEGALSKRARTDDNCYCIDLTPETCDKSFAMTSSFTNMYLTTLLAFNYDRFDEIAADVEVVCKGVERMFERCDYFEKLVAEFEFDRYVPLGAAELKGIAQESHLKLLELTKGNVAATFDTPTGFRHGPKSIITDKTLTLLYLSDEAHARKYELDLLKEMTSQKKGNKILVIENAKDDVVEGMGNYVYNFEFGKKLDSSVLGLGYITAAQVLALFKSQHEGITTDDPCPTGEVNRVVTGVTLYPVD